MVDGVINIPLRGRPLSEIVAFGSEFAGSPDALDHFVAGPENRLAEVAVRAVLDGPTGKYNPVVLYGPPGTGKSHLARGIAEFCARQLARHRVGERVGIATPRTASDEDRSQAQSPGDSRRVVCASAKTFARELANAFEVHSVAEFRVKYRECALLVIEDVEQLATKSAAQEELVHTLDDLIESDRQVVLTASDHPTQLARLSVALRSRLVSGLTTPLLPPSREVRTILLRRLARLRRIELDTAAASVLTKEISGTVPKLIEALLEMEEPARLDGGVIDYDIARAYVESHAARQGPRIREIAVQAARYFSLRLADLRGPSRRRNVVTARSVAMYLARSLSGANYQQIGQEFGGRDHTTVMHSFRKIKGMIKSDPAIRKAVDHLREKFEGGPRTKKAKTNRKRTSA